MTCPRTKSVSIPYVPAMRRRVPAASPTAGPLIGLPLATLCVYTCGVIGRGMRAVGELVGA